MEDRAERGSPSLDSLHDERAKRGAIGRGIANPQECSSSFSNNNIAAAIRSRLGNRPPQPPLIINFQNYLKAQKKRNIRQMICYAQKYLPVLETGDATVLTTLSGPCRRHVMEALTAYSKYNGTYQRWQEIRQAHLLKWTNGNESFTSLQRFFNPSLTLDLMLQQIRRMIEKLPVQMAQIVRFGCLVGLRPAETVESVRLINNQLLFSKYYNADNQTLEHFRFPDIFLRQTKKAYISFVNPEILSEIVKDSDLEKNCKIPSHNTNMEYLRKLWIFFRVGLAHRYFHDII